MRRGNARGDELFQFQGRLYFELRASTGPPTIAHADSKEPLCLDQMRESDLLVAATDAVTGGRIAEMKRLNNYDAYYYRRDGQCPLPVLRIQYTDPERTWLYIDPRRGDVTSRYVARSRWNRWLYHGLHSLDFLFLIRRRPLWDVIALGLLLGGLVLSVTGVVVGWRYLQDLSRFFSSWAVDHSAWTQDVRNNQVREDGAKIAGASLCETSRREGRISQPPPMWTTARVRVRPIKQARLWETPPPQLSG